MGNPLILPNYSLGIALGLHLLLIFGLHFAPTERTFTTTRQLNVTLIAAQPAPKPPEVAEYLAPVQQVGGMEAPPEARQLEVAPAARPAAQPPLRQIQQRPARTPVQPQTAPPVLVTRQAAPAQLPAAQPKTEPPAALPDSGQLLTSLQQVAQLEDDLEESRLLYSKRPRTKYVTANTQEYLYASYMDAWRRKVERLGKLNYPAAARRLKLSGHPMLDVAINPDGSLHSIELLRSSGHSVIDDAAIQIARLGAPYAPLTSEMRAEVDVLHIVRTWKFGQGGLSTRAD